EVLALEWGKVRGGVGSEEKLSKCVTSLAGHPNLDRTDVGGIHRQGRADHLRVVAGDAQDPRAALVEARCDGRAVRTGHPALTIIGEVPEVRVRARGGIGVVRLVGMPAGHTADELIAGVGGELTV